MESLLIGIPVVLYLNYILVTKLSTETYLASLEELLNRFCGAGLFLSKENCIFMLQSVKSLGHIIDINSVSNTS